MKELQFHVGGTGALVILLIILLPYNSIAHAQQTGCQLPQAWKGTWVQHEYQKDHHVIKIDNVSINLDKGERLLGTCIRKANNDLFIFVNHDEKCTSCVSIHNLDYNVLQYKQTGCVDVDITKLDEASMDQICSDIISADVFYLIRYVFNAASCPFRNEAFFFSHGKEFTNQKTVCSKSKSHTESCYDDTQLVFKYEACPDMATSSKVEEIQCVGKWEDGAHNYFIATVKESQNPAKYVSGKFRCFIYKEIRDPEIASKRRIGADQVVGYNVSISETATCAGLDGIHAGVMSLSMYLGDETQPSSSFPSWFNSKSTIWQSLGHDLVISKAKKHSEVRFKNSSDSRRGDSHNLGKFTCRQKSENNDNDVTLLCKEIVGCTSRDVCIQLIRKAEIISQITLQYKGDQFTQEQFESKCMSLNNTELDEISILHKDDKEIILLQQNLSERAEPVQCPLIGSFKLTDFLRNGSFFENNCSSSNPMMTHPHNLFIGCDHNQQTARFKNNCEGGGKLKQSTVAQCRGSWQVDNRTYFVISFVDNISHPITFCFAFQNTTDNAKILVHGSMSHCPSESNPTDNSFGFFMENLGICVNDTLLISSEKVLQSQSTGPPRLLLDNFLLLIATVVVVVATTFSAM